MPPLAPPVEAALREARQALAALYGDRLVRVVLFGSHARGEAHEESDVDVLVVLRDPVNVAHEIKRLVPVEVDLLDRYDLIVHLLPFSATRYEDRTHPLMMNVHQEGIELSVAA
jgi:predicted nucleotidyltransferase